jgi:hypothetical protein
LRASHVNNQVKPAAESKQDFHGFPRVLDWIDCETFFRHLVSY